ncbi:amidase [Paenibacillus sp. 19GGS1-52]|uniref:amidase n=1 Tax=Paenibacillus sp. 19GGS1-52 TaxID=2758563 RepID=UPI001EFB1BE9|nr:amidase [Paenibacillus sp. 19GGS1-52]ULO06326.1 amidase [Paenibacillus sp. 19GGS1-52]
MNNRYGAYITPELAVPNLGHGTLDGLIFAVKDVFAVAGHSSSAGNPDWLRSHGPSSGHAAAVRKLLLSGASLKGATHTDELMYSLGGENYHYGTPVNPRASDRIPGGSSSGSAVAVAAGSVDFALGTDTGGSTRVPSAYCGVYGFRPTLGAVSMEGVIPLAPGFDTVGWIADSVNMLQKVGTALLGSEEIRKSTMARVFVATDCWALAGQESAASLSAGLRQLQAGADSTSETVIAPEGLKGWMDVFRELQGDEIWATHGAWIEKVKPTFGPDIAARFAWAASLSGKDHSLAQTMRQTISARLRLLLGEEKCLVIPTVPGPAPLLGGDLQQLEQNRSGAMMLSCIAGLAGLPQITLPVISDSGLPLGLSVIGGHGQDQRLLSWVKNIWQ